MKEKNNAKVIYPEELDMQKFLEPSLKEYFPKSTYTLYGVIEHSGVVYAGHYKAFIKKQNQWIKYDDANCIIFNQNSLSLQDAYMLFYMKK